MKVVTAKYGGFCFGVKNAVETAYKMAAEYKNGEKLVMLGELTHNDTVTSELKSQGFTIINDAEDVPEGSLLLHRGPGRTDR